MRRSLHCTRLLSGAFLIFAFAGFLFAAPPPPSKSSENYRMYFGSDEGKSVIKLVDAYLSVMYDSVSFQDFIYISLKRQRMYHIVNKRIVNIYTIAGSRFGIGNRRGSHQTPVGLHSIAEKYGHGVPKGGVMVSRQFTGEICNVAHQKECVGAHDVTSRVIWLKGEDPGLNQGEGVDSYHRYIYIHGTPEEGLIGTPSSDGCIRMRNEEVMDLFEYCFTGMKVLILNE